MIPKTIKKIFVIEKGDMEYKLWSRVNDWLYKKSKEIHGRDFRIHKTRRQYKITVILE